MIAASSSPGSSSNARSPSESCRGWRRSIVAVPDNAGEIDEKSRKIAVTRAEFAAWTEKLLARLDGPLRRALGDAKLTRDQVAEVLLVGGATRMPNVVERVREWFGKPPQCRLNPDEVVALGAAVQAGLHAQHQSSVDDIVVTDVAPFTLGIEVSKRLGSELRDGYFMPILHRNTAIPASRVQTVETLSSRTRPRWSLVVRIYPGRGAARRPRTSISAISASRASRAGRPGSRSTSASPTISTASSRSRPRSSRRSGPSATSSRSTPRG